MKSESSKASIASPKTGTRTLTILHFNDAYHVDPSPTEPVGGASRMLTALRKYSSRDPLIFFGGDIFSPSILSMVTKGKHMVGVLNLMGVQYSVVGNHDLDFGLAHFSALAGECTAKWVVSNTFNGDGSQLLHTVPWSITTSNDVRIGVIGLIEEEWITTLSMDPSLLKYEDFVETGRKLATFLKTEHGCHIVIALTHMRVPNDEILGAAAPEIDLILGGHDHFYWTKQDPTTGTWMCKAGDDFHYLVAIEAEVSFGEPYDIAVDGDRVVKRPMKVKTVDQVPILSDLAEDADMEGLIGESNEEMQRRLGKVAAISDVVLDTNTAIVRLKEGPIGNYLTDILRTESLAELGFMNGGTIRSGEQYGPGNITLKDLLQILPFEDTCTVLEATGAVVRAALENGVSQLPKQEGRFTQISGIKFTFDSSRPPRQRIIDVWVLDPKTNEYVDLDPERTYTVATKVYIAEGHDGFECLTPCKKLLDEESSFILSSLVKRHWMQERFMNMWTHKRIPTIHKAALKLLGRPVPKTDFMPRIRCQTEGRAVDLKNAN